jgi:hypothetical protein
VCLELLLEVQIVGQLHSRALSRAVKAVMSGFTDLYSARLNPVPEGISCRGLLEPSI